VEIRHSGKPLQNRADQFEAARIIGTKIFVGYAAIRLDLPSRVVRAAVVVLSNFQICHACKQIGDALTILLVVSVAARDVVRRAEFDFDAKGDFGIGIGAEFPESVFDGVDLFHGLSLGLWFVNSRFYRVAVCVPCVTVCLMNASA